ncbi:class I SAM-dependent DNA methyltransferase [Rheinheimera salexigens]|uniref:SAM-dependent methyltransferase n=1 Tax=Rheinheimera salexigens TaxID=1628148 RepID=A0A1E7Q3N7_9GAMM|nr:class I SAM-dependent methyltransferase [Rheinheimera salexigens]OEY68812.1 SAM-dependent methyltransferase [Rheinheimera salexigens]
MSSSTQLYTDLSHYYDLMCCDINYQQQSQAVMRLNDLFGNSGKSHLDLACGTGPHIRHFIDAGYQSSGLDINQPMLDIAKARCPEAEFILQNMNQFTLDQPVDLITCFLYSLHYNPDIAQLQQCIKQAYNALTPAGLFCFNTVDKLKICNNTAVRHSTTYDNKLFDFESAWFYCDQSDSQALKLNISKTNANVTKHWHDQHSMVAVSFNQLQQLLLPWFEVYILEHDYTSIQQYSGESGNALFVCVKR